MRERERERHGMRDRERESARDMNCRRETADREKDVSNLGHTLAKK